MIRITKMSEKYYGVKVRITSDEELENIEIFTSEGTPVILVNDLEDLSELGISPDEVIMV